MPFDLDHKNNPTHNPNQKYITQLSMLMVASLMTLPALAHPGHDAPTTVGSAFMSGALHPYGGLDHILLAVGFGLLMARGIKHGGIYGALTLVASLIVGFAVSFVMPTSLASMAEWGILASVIVTAIALLQDKRFFALVGVGALAVFHGMAHGFELPSGASSLGFASGMVIGMSLLYAVGLIIGHFISDNLPAQAKRHYIVEKLLAVLGLGALFLG